MAIKLTIGSLVCSLNIFFSDVTRANDREPLLTGDTLEGWTVINGSPTSWTRKGDLLVCTGQPGGWLSSDQKYSNFELELEFRLPKGGNSGVFLRAPREGEPSRDGMEIQVLDDHDSQYANLKPTQYAGSLYGVVAASPRVSKQAGEWQKMTIRLKGARLTVMLNGTEVVEANLDKQSEKFPDRPGLKQKEGYIGLQNHNSQVEFRNVRIRNMP